MTKFEFPDRVVMRACSIPRATGNHVHATTWRDAFGTLPTATAERSFIFLDAPTEDGQNVTVRPQRERTVDEGQTF